MLPSEQYPSPTNECFDFAELPPTSSPVQDTQETNFESTFISGRSSILLYPLFSFNVHNVLQLSSVVQRARGVAPESIKASVLVAIVELEGPDTVTTKKAHLEGSKISRLRLTVGDDDDSIVSLTAWRETAERWGNTTDEVGLKRGDVVFLESLSLLR